MLKRFFDIFFAFCGIVFLFPILLLVAILIVLDSRGGVFFFQERVGRNKKTFWIIKFRTMYKETKGNNLAITVGEDNRITGLGKWLRRFKLDEIPQLFNILIGQMSFVGPRPDVLKYAKIIAAKEETIFSVRPGLTDYASIEYIDESNLLAKSKNPEKTYIEEVLPRKISLSKRYIDKASFLEDIRIILKTIKTIF